MLDCWKQNKKTLKTFVRPTHVAQRYSFIFIAFKVSLVHGILNTLHMFAGERANFTQICRSYKCINRGIEVLIYYCRRVV